VFERTAWLINPVDCLPGGAVMSVVGVLLFCIVSTSVLVVDEYLAIHHFHHFAYCFVQPFQIDFAVSCVIFCNICS